MQDFPLQSVRLLPGPFLSAQQTNMEYLLSLDPDRLVAPYLTEAGLAPKKPSYGNWENSGLDGHTLGHVLTATALLAQGTDDPRPGVMLDYLVGEVARAQAQIGTGYVGGVPHGQELWARISSGDVEPDSFGLNGAWVPWYNLHKLFAGLIDAHTRTGNSLALEVVTGLANWWVAIAKTMSDSLFESMLTTEFGGMNTSFADLAALTGNPDYLWLSHRFSDQRLLGPLLNRTDPLTGMHANTQIAKAVGYARLAQVELPQSHLPGRPTAQELTGAARFFWDEVTQKRTLSFGGNSVREHFAADVSSSFESEQGPETCNTTNMLNLSRLLFLDGSQDQPDAALMDFYERATFNHILSSQHPNGGLVYFTPARPDHYRVYSSAQECFWCCVGTGLENHGRYTELIYTHAEGQLFINLGIASTLTWAPEGLTLRQTTTLTCTDTQVIEIAEAPSSSRPLTISIRIPAWTAGPVGLKINGVPATFITELPGYASVTRIWQAGDSISVQFPKAVTAEPAPDGYPSVSFRYGPSVLALRTSATKMTGLFADDSRMGHVASGPLHPLANTPVIIGLDAAACVTLTKNGASAAPSLDVTPDQPMALEPFSALHDSRYTLYFPTAASETDVPEVRRSLAQKDQHTLKLADNTVDWVKVGEQQPESDHEFTGAATWVGTAIGTKYRVTTQEFGYVFKTGAQVATSLEVSYQSAPADSHTSVLLDGKIIGEFTAPGSETNNSVLKATFPITEVLSEHPTVAIGVRAMSGMSTAHILEIRLLT